MSETRALEVREFDGKTGEFEAVALVYNVTDSYSTRFLPGCFAESLKDRLPVVHLNHLEGRDRQVAEIVDYKDSPQRLVVIGQLRPPTASDHARRAWAGLKERVFDMSIVFRRQEAREASDGVLEFAKAVLERVDFVLDGAVPGARVLSFRNANDIGPVAARIAAAERLAGAGDLWTPSGSARAALREADDALDALEG